MNGRNAWGAALVMVGVMAMPAAAQEQGHIGLTVSAPSAIGLIWHVSDRVAMRPEISFSFSETDAESTNLSDVSSHSVSLAGSALFYTGRWENLRTYVSPRLSYLWAGSNVEGSGPDIGSTQNAWGLSGSIGAQYTLGTRFAVFGEAGLTYSSSEVQTVTTGFPLDRTAWTFGTRTAIGGTLYF